MQEVPDGFRPLVTFDAVTGAFGPLHARRAEDGHLQLGFRVDDRHCNPSGVCHGGAWSTMADILMGLSVGLCTGASGPTVSLSLHFLSAAPRGAWVEGSARVLQQTPFLGFAECLFTVDGEPALRANGVFRLKSTPFGDIETLFAR